MANYVISNGSSAGAGTQQATSAAYQTIIIGTVNSTTAGAGSTVASGSPGSFRRGKWYDILVGTNGSPADNFMEFEVARVTTGSTATNVAANPLDAADQVHIVSVCVNSSSFGTVSVPNMWYIGMNQRASYRWVCAPGSEIVWPTTTSNGLILRQRSGNYTGTVTGTVMFQEQ